MFFPTAFIFPFIKFEYVGQVDALGTLRILEASSRIVSLYVFICFIAELLSKLNCTIAISTYQAALPSPLMKNILETLPLKTCMN